MSNIIEDASNAGEIALWGDDEEGDSTIVFDTWGDYHRFLERCARDMEHHMPVKATAKFEVLESGHRMITVRVNPMNVSSFVKYLQIAVALTKGLGDDQAGTIEIDDTDIEDEGLYCMCWSIRDDQFLKLIGVENMGFIDTYDYCCGCTKLVYTQPNSYCDAGRYIETDDGIMCRECVEKDADWYFEYYLEQIEEGKLTGFILDLPEGFSFITEETQWGTERFKFQNGWHPGMDDNPTRQLESLRKFGIKQAIFDVEPSQFYVEWAVAVRDEDVGLARAVLTLRAQGYERHGCVIAWEDLCGVDDACGERQYAVHIMFEDCEPDDQIVVQVASGSDDPRAMAFEAVLRAVRNGEYVLDRDERELLYEMCVEREGKWISYKTKEDVEPAELMKKALQNPQFIEIDRDAFIEGKIVPCKEGESGIKYADLGQQIEEMKE